MTGFKDILDAVPPCGDVWRQETYIDPVTGVTIMMMQKGVLDAPKFMSVAQLQTNQGPMNIQFPIDAATITEAATKWQATARAAIVHWDMKVRESQRRVIVPGAVNMPPGATNMTPLEMALDTFTKMVDDSQDARPLTPEWFRRQGAGCAVTFLNRIRADGTEGDFAAIENTRRKIKQKPSHDLSNDPPFEDS